MTTPTLPGIFSEPRRLEDTSLLAYEKILPTLTKREHAVFLALADFAGERGLTGGELAEAMGSTMVRVRPRLSGLFDKGLIRKLPARKSHARGESRAHPYSIAVPRSAVERWR